MNLTRSQKKFIKKNGKKKSIAEIARALNIPQESIKEYISHSGSNQFKFIEHQDLQNETVLLSYDIISQPMTWIKKNFIFFIILSPLVFFSYANSLGNAF